MSLTPHCQVLRTSLALRKYSPRVELLRTLAPTALAPADACCWAHLPTHQQRVADSLEGLRSALASPHKAADDVDAVVHPFDHTFPVASSGTSSSDVPTVILYAAFGSSCFPSMHAELVQAADEGSIRYVLRPVAPSQACAAPGCASVRVAATTAGNEPLLVGGFGVEMALKNMEYKAIDDSAKQQAKAAGTDGDASSTGAAGASDVEVRGFKFGTLATRRPDLGPELATFRDALLSAAESDGASLKVWDMKDLGLQASARVAPSSDPLRLLQDVAHNFPALAASLSRMSVNASLTAEVDANQKHMRAGTNMVTLNSMPLTLDTLDAFSLLDAVTVELAFADTLGGLNLTDTAVRQLAAVPEPQVGATRLRFDDAPAFWANDIASDGFSARWPTSLRGLLTPRFPGRLPSVRRNLYYAILVADPASEEALDFAEAAEYYISSAIPLRFGLVPCSAANGCTAQPGGEQTSSGGEEDEETVAAPVPTELSQRVSRLFAAIATSLGDDVAWKWLSAASQARKGAETGKKAPRKQATQGLTWSLCEAALTETLRGRAGGAAKASALLELALGSDDDSSQRGEDIGRKLSAAGSWASSRGVAGTTATLMMNGLVFTHKDTGGHGLDYVAVLLANQEANTLAEAVYTNALASDADDDDILTWLNRDALPTHNAQLISRDGTAPLRAHVPPQPLTSRGHADAQVLRYITAPPHVDAVCAVTHQLVADVSTKEGRAVVTPAMQALARGTAAQRASRLALIHSGGAAAGDVAPLARVMLAATQLSSRRAKIAPFLHALLTDDAAIAAADDETAFFARVAYLADESGLRGDALVEDIKANKAAAQKSLEAQARFVHSGSLGAAAQAALAQRGGAVLFSNGRVTALPPGSRLRPEDFELLSALELRDSATAVAAIVEKHLAPVGGSEVDEEEAPAERLSDAIAVACWALEQRRADMAAHSRSGMASASSRNLMAGLKLGVSGISVGDVRSAPVVVEGVLNPLSPEAQRLAPLLLLLRDTLGSRVAFRIALNPARDLGDLPLKAYYRFATPPAIGAAAGSLVQAPPPSAHFGALPSEKTLTLGMDVPEPWLVTSLRAPYDLDNLRLEDLGPGVRGFTAAFELEHLMVTGHASDVGASQPPRGVQLMLLTSGRAGGGGVGTIVMSNLGYFQLKSGPGVHTLAIAPGRSRQLYSLQPGGVTDLLPRMSGRTRQAAGGESDLSQPLAVGDFSGRLLRLRLRKRPGMEKEDVLSGDTGVADSGGGLWGRMFGAPPSSGDALAPAGEDNSRIHIFSVASGHLYERFLKIMVLSVLKNTQTPAKFWFIKNYLSPGFKQFLPAFAAQYGFEYELVTYKWPSWLHKQSEKQRIIWAYKVLFLDVLFPLTLRKVIFVDADQIVRTDMKQLMDMDLHGASLGYTPMCDNNKDMEGYRFWKQGFWKDHLRGRPYHISALYVVDLAAFRRLAAGDQFRILYDNLAKDPNSLANLDQDLPNYAQHQVRIFSLPQEWLWCESWCGNATKAAAKTIDLCNNPMTKEPKLQGARRIVAEWTALDDEARAFTERVQAEGDSTSAQEAASDAPHGMRPDAAEL